MGRHTEPGTGVPTPDRGFWVRAGVVVAVGVLGAAFVLTRGGDGNVSTASPTASPAATSTGSPGSGGSSGSASAAPSSPSPSSPSSTSSPPSTSSPSSPSSPSSTQRPPTLAFRLLRDSYITVRVPGGETLVSKVFREGQRGSFDQRVLEVVNGRPSAVRFTVNGRPRMPGPPEKPETFTVRRE